MNSPDFVIFIFQITTLLGFAVFFGELMRRTGQPAVLGEMIGGIILGPTILGFIAPGFYAGFFHYSATVTAMREVVIKLGMLFFLFIVGTEIDLFALQRSGNKALSIGIVGTLIPIGIGVALTYLFPREFWGSQVQKYFLPFALFIGMNLANSANPVIARILMDLGLLRKEIGTITMAATVVDDLVNWILFAVILNVSGIAGQLKSNLPVNIVVVCIFIIIVLYGGRWFGKKAFPWFKAHVSWPAGMIASTTLAIFLAAALAEQFGIHAFLGAFLVGIALGGGYNDAARNEVRELMTNFALSFFAPIYFVSLGLNVNFISNFDFVLVSVIIVAAFLSKIGAVTIGARLAGMRLNREVLAIGFGLNARGATGIILAGVGLTYGLIDQRIFVAIVLMALVTSLVSGPMIKLLLKR
ncbi:MAG: cation:proton antiporter [Candidatus Omnitrophica bacterium]|nr:cation:proton antiporter [Candidatus Omnitrophota bacterium]